MDSLTYRLATPEDVDALVALVTSAYRGDASKQGWTTEADLLHGPRIAASELSRDLERENSEVMLALRDGDITGCVHIEKKDADTGYLGMFAVRPTGQGRGVGKALMKTAEEYAAKQWGIRRMQMTVIDVRAELLAFYERRGYRRTGATKPFPYGQPEFGDPQHPSLQFAILEKELDLAEPTRANLSSRAQAEAQVQVDNESMRVTKWTFAPGSETGWHTHEWEYAVVPVTDGILHVETERGSFDASISAGVSYTRDVPARHNVSNPGDTEFSFVEVEIKPVEVKPVEIKPFEVNLSGLG